ncbi:MAG: hypothetical protein L0Y42_08495 [Phycisphaerales bacterium]|nr:hypothetical protein [Phycisphaerales bacterium]
MDNQGLFWMMSSLTPPILAPLKRIGCPRCGYDQRGLIAMWLDSCPMTGVCTECGLTIEWAELLSDKVRKPRWCVEYARRWWHFPKRAAATVAVTFWPWGFWKSLKMTHQPRWSYLTCYLILLLLLGYLGFAAAQGYAAWRSYSLARLYWPGSVSSASGLQVVAHAAAWPFSANSPGSFTWSTVPGSVAGVTSTVPYPAPRDLLRRPSKDLDRLVGSTLVLHLLCMASFAALPQSRRQAKVRWIHIVRVMLYGLAPIVPWVLLVVSNALVREARWGTPGVDALLMVASAIATFAVLPFAVVWWSTATTHYLKMRHGWGVGLCVVTIASLATLLALALQSIATSYPS